MAPAALRIAILTHEHDTPRLMRGYVISLMAPIWRQDGHDVRFVFGPRRFVPADERSQIAEVHGAVASIRRAKTRTRAS